MFKKMSAVLILLVCGSLSYAAENRSCHSANGSFQLSEYYEDKTVTLSISEGFVAGPAKFPFASLNLVEGPKTMLSSEEQNGRRYEVYALQMTVSKKDGSPLSVDDVGDEELAREVYVICSETIRL